MSRSGNDIPGVVLEMRVDFANRQVVSNKFAFKHKKNEVARIIRL
jgi:hypothetical protein